MSTFKIYEAQNSKIVLSKGNFNDFKTYNDLKDSLGDSYHNFKLVFVDGTYIPEEVSEGIWDNDTYSFFLKKLRSHGIENGKYRLYIEEVNLLPKWHKKTDKELLDENLKKYWGSAMKDISNELNLMKLEESKNTFEKMKEEYKKHEEDLKSINHKNIICCNCLDKDFSGKRFICSECDNFNLCQNCEQISHEKEIHPREHVFIQINKNLEDDISKYNNIIGKYCKEFTGVEQTFKLEFIIINSGEKDLQNCYVLPVRFGEKYISCNGIKITDSIGRGMKTKISLDVKLPKNFGYFEGYFRMFTPSGLPFGNVVSIKALVGN